jgi:hypothetical protein
MPDLEADIEAILENHLTEVQDICLALRKAIKEAAPDLQEEVKWGWGNIVYKRSKEICAISPYSYHVHLNFYQGVRLSAPSGVLEGNGRELRYIKLQSVEEVNPDLLAGLLRQAVALETDEEEKSHE